MGVFRLKGRPTNDMFLGIQTQGFDYVAQLPVGWGAMGSMEVGCGQAPKDMVVETLCRGPYVGLASSVARIQFALSPQ